MELNWELVKKYEPKVKLSFGDSVFSARSLWEVHTLNIDYDNYQLRNEYLKYSEEKQIKTCIEQMINQFCDELLWDQNASSESSRQARDKMVSFLISTIEEEKS